MKQMCSMKWEMPAWASSSYREPVPTRTAMVADRVWGMLQVMTRRPESRVVLR